jgi:hypothetical protein
MTTIQIELTDAQLASVEHRIAATTSTCAVRPQTVTELIQSYVDASLAGFRQVLVPDDEAGGTR